MAVAHSYCYELPLIIILSMASLVAMDPSLCEGMLLQDSQSQKEKLFFHKEKKKISMSNHKKNKQKKKKKKKNELGSTLCTLLPS